MLFALSFQFAQTTPRKNYQNILIDVNLCLKKGHKSTLYKRQSMRNLPIIIPAGLIKILYNSFDFVHV